MTAFGTCWTHISGDQEAERRGRNSVNAIPFRPTKFFAALMEFLAAKHSFGSEDRLESAVSDTVVGDGVPNCELSGGRF